MNTKTKERVLRCINEHDKKANGESIPLYHEGVCDGYKRCLWDMGYEVEYNKDGACDIVKRIK